MSKPATRKRIARSRKGEAKGSPILPMGKLRPLTNSVISIELDIVQVSKPDEEKVHELLQKPLLFSKNCSHRKRLLSWLKEESIPEEQIMKFGTLDSILGGGSCRLGVSLLPLSIVSSLVEKGKIAAHRIPEPYRESMVPFVYR